MVRKLIILKSALDYINGDLEKKSEVYNLNLSSELIPLINSSDEVIFAVIFSTLTEFNSVKKELCSINSNRCSFSFILCANEEELKPLNIEVLSNVSEIRVSPMTAFEAGIIINRNFLLLEEKFAQKSKAKNNLKLFEETKKDQDDLIDIAKALSNEKDLEKLLDLTLSLSKKITGADAGSIYLVENKANGMKCLQFKSSHTFSRVIPLKSFTMPVNDQSIAGYVTITGKVLNIPDVYKLSESGEFPFLHNSTFDVQHNYLTRSMLIAPMRNYQNDIIGVIQLINSKLGKSQLRDDEAYSIHLETREDFDTHVIPFSKKYEQLLEAIAGLAGIAIENNRLIQQIEHQFEEFVKASVKAIESRDPATSGHSFRVAEICKKIAYAVNEVEEGYLKDINFPDFAIKELEFAALLHDFGKVYVDLSLFRKEKKLFYKDLENLMTRLDYLYRYIELQYEKEGNKLILEGAGKEKISETNDAKNSYLDKILDIKKRIFSLNEPSITSSSSKSELDEIVNSLESMHCFNLDGNEIDILTDDNKTNLNIKIGTLNPAERKEIEDHVVQTYNFINNIPWPDGYKNIPEIALRHHEKLNGSGYPDGLKGRENISIQSRIMAIADIFDALVSHDRPYKKATPLNKALDILREEVERGNLDPDLVDLFMEKRLYEDKVVV